MVNELQTIVQESGLESTKAQFILEKFQNYFEIAAQWEEKAKTIVVTNESQTAEMKMARTGRLFLREKRIAVEKARKELKEQALREGKAIDGIANVLKALIVPIEDYLEQQEKFVELREAAERAVKQAEIERRMEEERIAKEKAEAEERERIRLENEKLKAEAVEREKQMAAEKKAIEDKARKEKEAIEKAAEAEKERQAKIITEQKARAEKEKRAAAEREKELKVKAEAEKRERERLEDELSKQIECPFCHRKFNPAKQYKDDPCGV